MRKLSLNEAVSTDWQREEVHKLKDGEKKRKKESLVLTSFSHKGSKKDSLSNQEMKMSFNYGAF